MSEAAPTLTGMHQTLFGSAPSAERRAAVAAKLTHHLHMGLHVGPAGGTAPRYNERLAELGARGTTTDYFIRLIAANFKIPQSAVSDAVNRFNTFGELVDFICERTKVL